MKYLYFLLTLGALVVSTFHYAGEPFLPASALAAVVFAAVLVSLTLFLLRRRPGIAHGVVWGFAVSGLAVELNTNMTHLLARAGLDWLGAAGYAPLNEELLKFLGVVLICTCVIRPRNWLDYVFVGVAVGIGFTAGEDAIWPLLAGMAVVLAVWIATIWGVIALRKKAAAHSPLSPAPARA